MKKLSVSFLFFMFVVFNLNGEIKILDFDKTVHGVKFKGLEKVSVPGSPN